MKNYLNGLSQLVRNYMPQKLKDKTKDSLKSNNPLVKLTLLKPKNS